MILYYCSFLFWAKIMDKLTLPRLMYVIGIIVWDFRLGTKRYFLIREVMHLFIRNERHRLGRSFVNMPQAKLILIQLLLSFDPFSFGSVHSFDLCDDKHVMD